MSGELEAVSGRLGERLISAYEQVSTALTPGAEVVNVKLTAMQCATIMSTLTYQFEDAFGEPMPKGGRS